MKKKFILFISLFLLSCTSEKQQSFIDSCPEVLFSKDHRIYINTEGNFITINNISYKAVINNYNFTNACNILNNKIIAELSILFVVQPENAQKADFVMPYYIALLDDKKNIVEIQYYKVKGILKKNIYESSYIETEVIDTTSVIIPIQEGNESPKNKILIGFMLDKEKQNILNY